ncbi:MAG: T9SS type A sorting domain-containing protein [Chitinophagales bacterium]|nr:T9SS type A sorting domain-containing protein [Chitinophagales bacterium]
MQTKKTFLMGAFFLISSFGFSQVTITFAVDMKGINIGPGGMHIAGTFASAGSTTIQSDWQPDAPGSQLTLDSFSTYSIDVDFPSSSAGETLQFLFVRNDIWNDNYTDYSEGNPGATFLNANCGLPDGFGGYNRAIIIPGYDASYPARWDHCASLISNQCVATVTTNGTTSLCEGESVVLSVSVNNATGYQWKRNNASIPGETNNSYSAAQPGTYRCNVADDCGIVSSNKVKVEVSHQCKGSVIVGAADDGGSQLKVYPNPASNTINVAMPEKEGKLIISNSLGQILYSKNLFSNEDALDLSGFAKGIYLITVLSSTQKLQSQFLKL